MNTFIHITDNESLEIENCKKILEYNDVSERLLKKQESSYPQLSEQTQMKYILHQAGQNPTTGR
jgi:hypothetical protein